MTVFYKSKQKGIQQPSDRARLTAKIPRLVNYIWRGDLDALNLVSLSHGLDSYHAGLADYVTREGKGEEVAAKLVRNILSVRPELIAMEMEALREEAGVGDAAVEHFIISVRPDEELLANFDDVVDIFLDGMGLSRCPTVAAVHLDTDNPHLHIMVLRIDHETGEAVPLPQYDIIRGHQILAVLEDEFGWSREEGARYTVENGRLMRDRKADLGPADQPCSWPDEFAPPLELSSKAKAWEARTGIESPERIIKRVVPTILEASADLESLLRALEKEGISLATKGSGSHYRVTFTDEHGLKREEFVQTSVLRNWTYNSLVREFGDLPKDHSPSSIGRTDKAIDGDGRRVAYAQAAQKHQAQLNKLVAEVLSATKHMSDRKAAIGQAKSACAFPSFDDWKNGAIPSDAASIIADRIGVSFISAPGAQDFSATPTPMPDENFIASKNGRGVVYRPRAGLLGNSRIIDFGGHIILVGETSDMAIEKALILFKLRGATGVSAAGFSRSEFRKAQKIAADMGLALVKEGKSPEGKNELPTKTAPSTGPANVAHEPKTNREIQPDRQPEQSPPAGRPPTMEPAVPDQTARTQMPHVQQPDRSPPATAAPSVSPYSDEALNALLLAMQQEQERKEKQVVPEKLLVWRQAEQVLRKLKDDNADKQELRKAEVNRNRLASILQSGIDAGEIDRKIMNYGEQSVLELQVYNYRRDAAWLQGQGQSMGLER